MRSQQATVPDRIIFCCASSCAEKAFGCTVDLTALCHSASDRVAAQRLQRRAVGQDVKTRAQLRRALRRHHAILRRALRRIATHCGPARTSLRSHRLCREQRRAVALHSVTRRESQSVNRSARRSASRVRSQHTKMRWRSSAPTPSMSATNSLAISSSRPEGETDSAWLARRCCSLSQLSVLHVGRCMVLRQVSQLV